MLKYHFVIQSKGKVAARSTTLQEAKDYAKHASGTNRHKYNIYRLSKRGGDLHFLGSYEGGLRSEPF